MRPDSMPRPWSQDCGECGMSCTPNEYHPYAACLMFKACRDGEKVRSNLAYVIAHGHKQGYDEARKALAGSGRDG